MINKLLVPIAFSKYSRGILQYAADIAEAFKAEMHVANVINNRDLEAVNKITSFGYKVDGDKYVEIIKKERREQLDEITQPLSLPNDQVMFTFLIGDPTSELLRYVVEANIDLVVMGLKAKDIAHLFTGSVAERMFQRCPVPILSYRSGDIAERLLRRVHKHIIED